MWALENRTRYAAERTWILNKDAAKCWVVVVKATFSVHPDGTTQLADVQEPPLHAVKYSGEPGKSSLLYEADLTGPKNATDLLINGTAYAPRGQPTTQVTVSLSVNGVTKQLVVFGDRRWEKGWLGLSMSQPEPFKSLPITYERAFGGSDTRADDPKAHRHESHNPIGAGFAVRQEHLVDQPLPNVEHPDELIRGWKDRPRPGGFGPIASYWSPRLEFAGTYDEKWQKERFPLPAEDFDDRHNQSAPADQQASGFLHGGELVDLLNLTPGGRMAFKLPKIRPSFMTLFGREKVEHRATINALIIEPDKTRFMIVWQTILPCHHKMDQLDRTVISEKRYIGAE